MRYLCVLSFCLIGFAAHADDLMKVNFGNLEARFKNASSDENGLIFYLGPENLRALGIAQLLPTNNLSLGFGAEIEWKDDRIEEIRPSIDVEFRF